ncbi:MAG: hypothetical protein VX755_03065, partial [Pseudomonadota bacterium]|nr:hypothetical protein [Pseudomonadota bacterium]
PALSSFGRGPCSWDWSTSRTSAGSTLSSPCHEVVEMNRKRLVILLSAALAIAAFIAGAAAQRAGMFVPDRSTLTRDVS